MFEQMPFLFVALFLSLLISQSIMDLMTFIVLVATLFLSRKEEIFQKLGIEGLWPFWIGIFILALGINRGWSDPQTWIRLHEYKWILNFYFGVWFFIWLQPWKQEKLWFYIWAGLLSFSLYGLICLILDFDLFQQAPLSDPGRVGGLFDDPMTFAHVYGCFCALSFGCVLGLFEHKKFRDWKGADFLLMAACSTTALAVFLSMTRGIWIGLSLALLVMTFLWRPRWALALFGVLASIVILLVSIWPRFRERIFFAFNFENNYDSERVWLWKANWRIFQDYPWMGLGYGEYKTQLRFYYDQMGAPLGQFESHAHNQYLHFLAGMGFLGLLCFLIFVVYLLWKNFQALRRWSVTEKPHFLALGVLGAQICFLIGGLTESNFERSKVRMTYLMLSGLAVALTVRKSHTDDNSLDK